MHERNGRCSDEGEVCISQGAGSVRIQMLKNEQEHSEEEHSSVSVRFICGFFLPGSDLNIYSWLFSHWGRPNISDPITKEGCFIIQLLTLTSVSEDDIFSLIPRFHRDAQFELH